MISRTTPSARFSAFAFATASVIALGAAPARAGNFVEGADVGGSKPIATVVANWADTETIMGTVSSSADLDYYRISAPIAAPGIYRQRINLTMGSGGRASTRGTGVNAPSDVNFNSDRFSGEYLTWYTFGHGGEMYVRANRTTTGSNSYTMTHSLSAVAPLDIGTLPIGAHTLAAVLLSDSEIYLYDANYALVGQNDSQIGGDVRAKMVYDFTTAGDYYIAIGSGNSSTYVGAISMPQAYSPVTTDPFYDCNCGSFPRPTVLDFQNVVSRPENISRTAAEFGLAIDGGAAIDAAGPIGGQEMAWFKVTIVPACALIGDMNVSGAVEGDDIQGFVDCTIGGGPGCTCADVNTSGVADSADVPPFVDLLLGL